MTQTSIFDLSDALRPLRQAPLQSNSWKKKRPVLTEALVQLKIDEERERQGKAERYSSAQPLVLERPMPCLKRPARSVPRVSIS